MWFRERKCLVPGQTARKRKSQNLQPGLWSEPHAFPQRQAVASEGKRGKQATDLMLLQKHFV